MSARLTLLLSVCGWLLFGFPSFVSAVLQPSPEHEPSEAGIGHTQAGPSNQSALEGNARQTAQPIPSVISLDPGEILSLKVDEISRAAIGNPDVVDIRIVSSDEILLQAKAAGSTNLILWDRQGQHVSNVEVIDRALETLEVQLQQVLENLDFVGVQVKRENNKLFLVGELHQDQDLERLEQVLSAYKQEVTNLVTVTPPPPAAAPAPPQSVKLAVQVIEMAQDATDKLGVDWVDSLKVTETTFGAVGLSASQPSRFREMFRLGSFSRSEAGGAITGTLNLLAQQGKLRLLAEPKLVAASGKEASTVLGAEVPIITTTELSTTGVVSQSIEFKNTGVELTFTPTVLEDGRSIQVAVRSKVSSIDLSNAITVGGVKVPGFKTREARSEFVTESGRSVIIAGLLQEEEKKNLAQVPAIGSIPVLGNLFRSTEFVRGHTELVIVVTPELLAEAAVVVDKAFALEQALAGAEIAASVEDPTLRYALQVQDRVAKALRYPQREKELGMSGRVKLRLHLFRDGTLGRAVVSESSGLEALDAEALKAAESQSPYPAFPSQLIQQDLWLELPVVFRP